MSGRHRIVAWLAVAVFAVGSLVGCAATVNGSGALTGPPTDASGAASSSGAPGPSNGSGASDVPSTSDAAGPSGPAGPSDTASAGSPGNCPASYLPPDPDRPRVELAFTVRPGLATVDGTEHIEFTPDLPITELVFRLTANTAPTVAEGNRIQVRSARADHGGLTATYARAGADPGTQGGLLRIPFASEIPAGTTVSADLSFTVTLGSNSFDRFGRTDGYAWFGSAQPLLAWERGFGWHTEPMIQFTAESATSEAMRTELTVTAPASDTVIMSGDPTSGTPDGSGARVWRSTIDAARDVSVAVGPFAVTDVKVGSVALRVGAYDPSVRDALVPEFERAITELSARFGPYPFPSLSVARLPAEGGGIEYPSSILMLDGSRMVVVHETAHQWFYAMVGDSQATHAWLDEAFATYAEALVDDDPPPANYLHLAGRVDRPTADYGGDENDYYLVTYYKGAAALLAARDDAGGKAFDAALRCYANANAWRIANPADLAAALAGLPAALSVLRQAQALR
ncbi:MAG: peptidase M1 [Actinomycetia bacterium]|nr:peptidase M1 [Actinomycetes bacterium]